MRSYGSHVTQALRRGFTMIELMVVLVVITILLAILIPAVQQSRMTASQVQCRVRMKQIGLALHGHEATFGQFPAFVNDRFSWLVTLLPYMELSSVRDKLDLKAGAGDSVNEKIYLIPIEVYCCPTDPSRRISATSQRL